MNKTIYITTSIPYVNAVPHIGYALEAVQADALSRWYKENGYDVFLSAGTDENAIKNTEAAEKANTPVQEFVDAHSKQFADLRTTLDFAYDAFIKTSGDNHKNGSQAMWRLCAHDIYKKIYHGLYCVGCETFYEDGEFSNNICPFHNRPLELVSEENYFFRLSAYQKQLHDLIASDTIRIYPAFRKKEVLNFIDKGLTDFSISRPVERTKHWGIPVPNDSSQMMYVWFDALTNYITVLGFHTHDKNYETYWMNNPNRFHVIGKDIVKFHAIYWPAMLMSAQLPLPTKIFVHGFITVDGRKMSKSIGNVIYPPDIVKKYGIDAVRYYLLREIPSLTDGDYSEQRMKEIYNNDLANELGNLVSRVTTLCEKHKCIVPDVPKSPFSKEAETMIGDAVQSFEFSRALAYIWVHIKALNARINTDTPWSKSPEKAKPLLMEYAAQLYWISRFLKPFLPHAAPSIESNCIGTLKKLPPIFPRIV